MNKLQLRKLADHQVARLYTKLLTLNPRERMQYLFLSEDAATHWEGVVSWRVGCGDLESIIGAFCSFCKIYGDRIRCPNCPLSIVGSYCNDQGGEAEERGLWLICQDELGGVDSDEWTHDPGKYCRRMLDTLRDIRDICALAVGKGKMQYVLKVLLRLDCEDDAEARSEAGAIIAQLNLPAGLAGETVLRRHGTNRVLDRQEVQPFSSEESTTDLGKEEDGK